MRTIENIQLYTVSETANLLGITAQTVRSYIKNGKLNGQRIGRPVFISNNSIKEFIKGRSNN